MRRSCPEAGSSSGRAGDGLGLAEARDVATLPGGLDRPRVVVRSNVGDRFARRYVVQHRQTRQRGAGSAPAAAARDLNPLGGRATPGFSERVPRIQAVCGQPEVRPADPPALPRRRPRSRVQQVNTELRLNSVWFWLTQSATTDQSTRRQRHDTGRTRAPRPHGSHAIAGACPVARSSTGHRCVRGDPCT
jgi:hypothetical protein